MSEPVSAHPPDSKPALLALPDPKTIRRNVIKTVALVVVAVAALFAPRLTDEMRKLIVGMAFTYIVGLWSHSGKKRTVTTKLPTDGN